MKHDKLKSRFDGSVRLILEYTDNIYILGSIVAMKKAIKRNNIEYSKKLINRICDWYDYEIEIICHEIKDSTRQQYLDTHGILFEYKDFLESKSE